MTEFAKTVTFFGEDPKILNAHDVFGIFSEFVKNFEVNCIYFFMYVCMLIGLCVHIYSATHNSNIQMQEHNIELMRLNRKF